MKASPPDREIDPELERQLNETGGSNAKIAAVLKLRQPSNAAVYPPEQISDAVRELLSRVAERVGKREDASNVFSFLGSFVVVADAPFIRELIQQPEISAAAANNQQTVGTAAPHSLKS